MHRQVCPRNELKQIEELARASNEAKSQSGSESFHFPSCFFLLKPKRHLIEFISQLTNSPIPCSLPVPSNHGSSTANSRGRRKSNTSTCSHAAMRGRASWLFTSLLSDPFRHFNGTAAHWWHWHGNPGWPPQPPEAGHPTANVQGAVNNVSGVGLY